MNYVLFPLQGHSFKLTNHKNAEKTKTETKTVKMAFFGNSNLTQPQLKLSSYSIQAHNSKNIRSHLVPMQISC